MSSTDVEVHDGPATPPTDIARNATPTELDNAARLGYWLAAAESGARTPQALGMAAALRIAYAGHLGLAPHAAAEVHVIKGNLTLSAKLCRALAHNHGLRVIRVEETPVSCTAAVIDAKGVVLGQSTYTIDQAAARGLTSRDNWKTQPDRMLWARASKQVLDDFAPWVTVGVMLDDEAQEDAPPEAFDSDEVLEGTVE